jgi:2-dehydro-3-deoxygluconokinase
MDILSLGEPLLEFTQLREGGREVYLPGFGGDTSNMAVAAARQGARVGCLTRLGGDAFGDMFMNLWRSEGIDTSHVVRDPEAPTGIYFVTHTEAGHAFTYFRKGSAASRMQPGEVPEEAIAAAKILHVSGISQAISEGACDAVFRAVELARTHGVKVSYDPNLRLKLWPLPRARAIIMETVGLSDICLPSLEEARELTGLAEPEAIVDALLERGAGLVALKLGAEGALVARGAERHRIPGRQVATVDATGAGDTFDGAFLAALVAGRSLHDAGKYANAAAALATRGYGAVNPIPRREEVEAFLAD